MDTTASAGARRTVFLDPISGASGDMILGALLDAGAPLDRLIDALRTLPLAGWSLDAEPVMRGALGATLARIRTDDGEQPHRHLGDVLRLIDAATLPGRAADWARAIFTRLAEAEARVHRTSIEAVHFHEVGAVDAIVDICGAASALALLGIDHVYAGLLPLGGGTTSSAHGTLPLPAPATLELLALAGAPTIPHEARVELVTPTGAAIITTLAHFERPAMHVRAVGYGAGSRLTPEPNVLRAIVGDLGRTRQEPDGTLERSQTLDGGASGRDGLEAWSEFATSEAGEGGDERLLILECNIDDMNPQWYGHLFERALTQGALDVTCTPVLMKKGRPGQTLSLLARPEHAAALTTLLLEETTSLGVRRHAVLRTVAVRRMHSVETAYGPIPIKLRITGGRISGATPEYDWLRRAADERGVPLARVSAAAQAAVHPLLGAPERALDGSGTLTANSRRSRDGHEGAAEVKASGMDLDLPIHATAAERERALGTDDAARVPDRVDAGA